MAADCVSLRTKKTRYATNHLKWRRAAPYQRREKQHRALDQRRRLMDTSLYRNGSRNFPRPSDLGGELLACTSKGIYCSTNGGVSWTPRCTTSSAGDFLSLAADGTKLLATTSKGLYTSTNRGVSWVRR